MPKIQKNSSEVTERNVSASQIAAKTKNNVFSNIYYGSNTAHLFLTCIGISNE